MDNKHILSEMFRDPYIRKMLAINFLDGGYISKDLADILITKSLINNYL